MLDLTFEDQKIVGYAERTLAEGAELERWFEQRDAENAFAERFNVVREFSTGDRSFGFFDEAPIGGRDLRVMGIVQEMFYDRQKTATGLDILPQVREFILHYFMRVSHLRQPEAAAEADSVPTSSLLKMMSWLPDANESQIGFGFQQLFYKTTDGEVGKFAPDEMNAIVDLREVGPRYAWIVLKVDIFNFNLSFAPLGAGAPRMMYPLKESTFLVLGPQFVRNRERREPGVLGEYGYGYAFMPYAPPGGPDIVAYGPGHFAAAFQSVHFKVMESGDIRVRASFIVNRPEKVAKINIDPIDWTFRLADLVTFNMASRLMGPVKDVADRLPLRISGIDPIGTYISVANYVSGGRAAQQLGHSMSVLEKRMLLQHFMQHYEMLINSLLVWRKIVDWTDGANLPDYCREGVVGA
jgi:hypothetical protein